MRYPGCSIDEFEASIRTHLLSAVGYYRSLVLRLQNTIHPTASDDPSCCQDRYLVDFGAPCAKSLAYKFYSLAVNVDPESGLAHNQLAVLNIGRCYDLDAIYHYLRALTSRGQSFEGAKSNMTALFDRNQRRFNKAVGQKRNFDLFARCPQKYGRKDFQKTITIFVYIIQQFMQPVDKPRPINRLIACCLHELNLMLVGSRSQFIEDPHKPSVAESQEQDPYFIQPDLDRNPLHRSFPHRLFSDQLTGAAYYRIFLIALLTTAVADMAKSSKQSGESSQRQSRPVNSTGPIAFLLRIGHLFLAHLIDQFDSQMQTCSDAGSSKLRDSTVPRASHSSLLSDTGADPPANMSSDQVVVDQTSDHDQVNSEPNNSSSSSDEEEGQDLSTSRRVLDSSSSRKPVEGFCFDDEDEEDQSDGDETWFSRGGGSCLLHSQDDEEEEDDLVDGDHRSSVDTSLDRRLRQIVSDPLIGKKVDARIEDGGLGEELPDENASHRTAVSDNEIDIVRSNNERLNVDLSSGGSSRATSLSSNHSLRRTEEEDHRRVLESQALEQQATSSLHLVSRLYLLASVKLLADWIESIQFACLLDQDDEDSESKSKPSLVVVPAAIQQLWLDQFSALLQRLSPLHTALLAAGQDEPTLPGVDHRHQQADDTLSQSVVGDDDDSVHLLLSPFGRCQLRQALSQGRLTCALPEDYLLRGFLSSYSKLAFSQTRPLLTELDEAALRTIGLFQFARRLEEKVASSSSGLDFTVPPSSSASSIVPRHRRIDLIALFRPKRPNTTDNRHRREMPRSRRRRPPRQGYHHSTRGDLDQRPLNPSSSEMPVDDDIMPIRSVPANDESSMTTNHTTTRSTSSSSDPSADLKGGGEQLMRQMARLRLANECDQLALRCNESQQSTTRDQSKSATGKPSLLSPYLVLDAQALIGHLPAIKELVRSTSFVLVVPLAVISHLDCLKKTVAAARVAIRYLELEAYDGNRLFKVQRREECLDDDPSCQTTTSLGGESSSSAIVDTVSQKTIVNRWLAILDCARYFQQQLVQPRNVAGTLSSDKDVESTMTLQEEEEISKPEGASVNLITYLANHHGSSLRTASGQEEAHTPVTILVGSRNTVDQQDFIVPSRLIDEAVERHGIHFELIKSFYKRWNRSK